MEILRYAAFTDDPSGGNPAGVVLDATGLTDAAMLAVAADVGYSETAFLVGDGDHPDEFRVRYFSALAEVPFCGHATIASGVAHAERHGAGTLHLHTQAGPVDVSTTGGERPTATLVSVEPRVEPIVRLDDLLTALRWDPADLDPTLPPRVAFAGARHPVLAARSAERLAALDYDYDPLAALMAEHDWTTVDLVHRTGDREFEARNPFPPGGVVEDPATGAAAAAFGGYLRALGVIDVPAAVTVRQGHHIGRPGRIEVSIPARGGIAVTGSAAPIGG